jgi:type VI secretion system protein VasL
VAAFFYAGRYHCQSATLGEHLRRLAESSDGETASLHDVERHLQALINREALLKNKEQPAPVKPHF